jgi:hypothetical protein
MGLHVKYELNKFYHLTSKFVDTTYTNSFLFIKDYKFRDGEMQYVYDLHKPIGTILSTNIHRTEDVLDMWKLKRPSKLSLVLK